MNKANFYINMNLNKKNSDKQYVKTLRLIPILLCFNYTAALAVLKAPITDYQKQIKKTADSLIRLNPKNDATEYYSLVLDKLFARAIDFSHQEIKRSKKSVENKMSHKVLSELNTLRSSLTKNSSEKRKGIPLGSGFKETVIASLRNFTRYQMPSAYDQHKRYLWIMIQVLENVNQINLGYKYTGLSEEEQLIVLERLRIQQKLIQEIRTILDQ